MKTLKSLHMGLLWFLAPRARRQLRIPLRILFTFVLLPERDAYGDQNVQRFAAVEQFKAETVFWKQLEIGQRIILTKETRVLSELEPWLTHPDRHIRGNVAFVFGSLGDLRGFEVLAAILRDSSDRPEGQGVSCAIRGDGNPCWSLRLQIASDRYYAVHLLGLLKDPSRAIHGQSAGWNQTVQMRVIQVCSTATNSRWRRVV